MRHEPGLDLRERCVAGITATGHGPAAVERSLMIGLAGGTAARQFGPVLDTVDRFVAPSEHVQTLIDKAIAAVKAAELAAARSSAAEAVSAFVYAVGFLTGFCVVLYGVKGLSTLLVDIVQFAPFSIRVLASVTPRITLCSICLPALKMSVAGRTASDTTARTSSPTPRPARDPTPSLRQIHPRSSSSGSPGSPSSR